MIHVHSTLQLMVHLASPPSVFMMHWYVPECFGSAFEILRVAISLATVISIPSLFESSSFCPLWVNVRSDLVPSLNWISIRILSFLFTCIVLETVSWDCWMTDDLDTLCDIDFDVEVVTLLMDWLSFFSTIVALDASNTVKLVLDFVAPAGFSNKQVNIPPSSVQAFLIVIVEQVSWLSIMISSQFFISNVYLNHFTTGAGLASNSTLKTAGSFSLTTTGSKDFVNNGAMKLAYWKIILRY